MRIFKILINSNIYISLGAVLLTLETQVQLGMLPQWHPYLFIIFFATLLEYNIHKFVAVISNKSELDSAKYTWVKKNLTVFYLLVLLSIAGCMCAVLLAKKEVLLMLIPIAVITLFYSLPVWGSMKIIFRLREIPYLKVFLIAFVWSCATILLPVIKAGNTFNSLHILAMLAERFFFVLAITIPFDVRDVEDDRQAGLKTLPLLINENKVFLISYLALSAFLLTSLVHYSFVSDWFILIPFCISAVTTFGFLYSKKVRSVSYYHYGILDGTMLLQGGLVLVFYFLFR